MTIERPAEPVPGQYVWYRGWECGFHDDAEFWTGHGWQAYKGGADIGAQAVVGVGDAVPEIVGQVRGAIAGEMFRSHCRARLVAIGSAPCWPRSLPVN